MKKIATVIVLCAGLPLLAHAERGRGEKPRHPPQEAFDACVDAQEGDLVSFETPRGDVLEGTCRIMRGGDELVAVPKKHKPRPPRDEVQEDIER